jgi:RNA polymerase sigma-70 factor, ECF subfamily
MSVSKDERSDEFLVLYRESERRIFAYLMALLGNPDDAEDVLQETILALWQSFDDFRPGTSFYAWARQAAYHRALVHRRRQQQQGLPWSESLFEVVDNICSQRDEQLLCYLQYLDECVARLAESDREILRLRFQPRRTIKSVAEQLHRPADTVYKALTRIYRWLALCVQRAASTETHP